MLDRRLDRATCGAVAAASVQSVQQVQQVRSAQGSTGGADVPTQLAAMDRLEFMVGRWAGPGWIIGASGVRQDFVQTENVRRQVGGLVVSVEGEGRDTADPRRVVDTALAVINYSDASQQYRWEAFSQGFVTVAVPVVGDRRFVWSLQITGATIRYTLTFTASTWHEIGEVTVDGGSTWHQNFQLDLRRTDPVRAS